MDYTSAQRFNRGIQARLIAGRPRIDYDYCREIDALDNNEVRRYSPNNEPIVVYENRKRK